VNTLWLLRHPPVLAESGLCYGRTDLDCAEGPTRDVARTIAPQLPADLDLRTSPLRRCARLADAIGTLRPDLRAARHDPRLAEMDFGAWEGQRWARIDRREFDDWMDDFAEARVGGTGESTRQFMARVGAAWDAWRASRRDALWVTHAGVMRAVTLLHAGVRCPVVAAEWPTGSIAFGEWTRLSA
jgi:alpha-ribazole phosphatase